MATKAKKKKAPPRKSAPASRRARAEEIRRARERRRIRTRLIATSVILAIIAAVVVGLVVNNDSTEEVGSTATCTADEKHDGASRDHIANPRYRVNPPAGGAHTPQAAQPGFYRPGEAVPSDGQLVHAMEHGFVVLWYRPDLGEADMQAIGALSDRFGRELIVAPRASLPANTPVAATAWHRRFLCTSIDADAIGRFTEARRDKGPEKGFL